MSVRGVSRDRIVELSREILERDGADALTIRRIAEAVDRTQPAIYQHFASKDALLETLAIDGFVALHARLELAARTDERPFDAVAEAYVRFGFERPRLYALMFVDPSDVTFASETRTPEPARASFAIFMKTLSRQTQLPVARADTATEVLWGAMHGLVMLSINNRYRPGVALVSERLELLKRGVLAIAKAASEA